MKPKKRQKLCTYCEGEVDLDVIVCPYCAADLREEKPEQQRPLFSAAAASVRSLNDTNQSLYPPSFPAKPAHEEAPPQNVEEAVFEEEEEKSPLGSIFLLSLGAQLLLFGLLQLIFSHKGTLSFHWNASYWFIYLFASVPLLIFGYKSLSK